MNFATDLRIAYTKGVRSVLDADAAVRDPKVYGKAGRAAVEELASRLIRVCGSENRL